MKSTVKRTIFAEHAKTYDLSPNGAEKDNNKTPERLRRPRPSLMNNEASEGLLTPEHTQPRSISGLLPTEIRHLVVEKLLNEQAADEQAYIDTGIRLALTCRHLFNDVAIIAERQRRCAKKAAAMGQLAEDAFQEVRLQRRAEIGPYYPGYQADWSEYDDLIAETLGHLEHTDYALKLRNDIKHRWPCGRPA